MKAKRKSVVVITAITLVALMLVGLTLAYLTDQKNVLNVLGLGRGQTPITPDPENPNNESILIKVHEPGFVNQYCNPNGTPKDPKQFTTEDVTRGDVTFKKYSLYNVLPNAKINKDPTVKNVGTDKVYIRVQLWTVDANNNHVAAITKAQFEDTAGIYQKLGLKIDTANWKWHSDGYLYYVDSASKCKIFESKESAPIFVTTGTGANAYTIHIGERVNNDDFASLNGFLRLEVQADAIQAADFKPDFSKAVPWAYAEDENEAVEIKPVK